MKTILIASDHAGFDLKEKIKPYLERKGLKVVDLGTYSKERCDYPVSAANLAKKISRGTYKQGILICKSGIGNSIVANRFPGVRASLCYNTKAAEMTRAHNDSNCLVLGSLFVNIKLAQRIVDVWLKTKFEGARHKRRLDELRKIEKAILK